MNHKPRRCWLLAHTDGDFKRSGFYGSPSKNHDLSFAPAKQRGQIAKNFLETPYPSRRSERARLSHSEKERIPPPRSLDGVCAEQPSASKQLTEAYEATSSKRAAPPFFMSTTVNFARTMRTSMAVAALGGPCEAPL